MDVKPGLQFKWRFCEIYFPNAFNETKTKVTTLRNNLLPTETTH